MWRSLYVDRNSSSATLRLTRSGYSRKLVIVTYITQQLSPLSPASAADDDDGGMVVAGVPIFPAVEGLDFTGSVSTVALGIDVVCMIHGACLAHSAAQSRPAGYMFCCCFLFFIYLFFNDSYQTS